jgi:hypothetical protein
VDFIEHDHVRLLHQRDLLEDLFSFATRPCIRRWIYQFAKLSGVGECRSDRVVLDTALDIPLCHAQERAELRTSR